MSGTVVWISVRPERKSEVRPVTQVAADVHTGLDGDHDTVPHRQVTLISKEVLDRVADTLGHGSIDPGATRRNIMISGLDLDLPAGTQVQVGTAILEITGPCHPCIRMDENLGSGGRMAMAGAGGLTARVLRSGQISIGDAVAIAHEHQ